MRRFAICRLSHGQARGGVDPGASSAVPAPLLRYQTDDQYIRGKCWPIQDGERLSRPFMRRRRGESVERGSVGDLFGPSVMSALKCQKATRRPLIRLKVLGGDGVIW